MRDSRIDRRSFLMAAGGALAGLGLGACGRGPVPSGGEAREGSAGATVVFRNGVVLPVDAAFSEHQALAIRGSRVLAVGTAAAVMAAAGTGATVIDLEGRTVLPGFIEPHMHFAVMAGLGHFKDIGPFNYPTFEGALDALREIGAGAGLDDWIEARQFDPSLHEPSRDLTVRELDAIAPDRPAWILNASGHIAYANSRALEVAGITRDTPDPEGGEYGRSEDGGPEDLERNPTWGPTRWVSTTSSPRRCGRWSRRGRAKAGPWRSTATVTRRSIRSSMPWRPRSGLSPATRRGNAIPITRSAAWSPASSPTSWFWTPTRARWSRPPSRISVSAKPGWTAAASSAGEPTSRETNTNRRE